MGLTNIKAKNQGFTIVELLIVVVVIAILAAITIVSYNGITNRANASAAASLASTLQKKVELFSADGPTATYPRALTDLTGGSAGTTTITGVTNRPTTSADSWYLAHGSINPASTLTSNNGKTTVIYTVCGHQGSTTAPGSIAAMTTLTGATIQYFDYEGPGNKTVTLGTVGATSGVANARGCYPVAS